MTDDTAPEQLTGVWEGQYRYLPLDDAVAFTATLLDLDGALSGTVHEVDEITQWAPQALNASIEGSRRGDVVTFTKRYSPAAPGYDRPVLYMGVLVDGGHEISGSWRVDLWTGRFMMLRPRASLLTAARKAVERV